MEEKSVNFDKEKVKKGMFTILLVFGVLFYFRGFFVLEDYGLPFDEFFEYEMLQKAGEYFKDFFSQIFSSAPIVDHTGYLEYVSRDYGIFAKLPILWIVDARHLTFLKASEVREVALLFHRYNYLIWGISILCFYRMLRRMECSRFSSLITTLLLLFTPRFVAESTYNTKDLLLVALCIITLDIGTVYVKKKSPLSFVLYAFFLAMTANLRYLAAVIFLPVMITELRDGIKGKKVAGLLGLGVTALFFYYLMMPMLWLHPIQGVYELLTRFSDFPWDADVRFCGKSYSAPDLPRYYLPLWILMTSSLAVLTLVFAGIVSHCKDDFETIKAAFSKTKDHETKKKSEYAYLRGTQMILWLVLLLDQIVRPTKFDAWRHFYFLVIPIMLYIPTGIGMIRWLKTKARYLIAGVIALFFILDVIWIFQYHPYEYVYLNQIARNYSRDFEDDYWLVSTYDACKHVLKRESDRIQSGEDVTISGYYYPGYYMLKDIEREHLKWVEYLDLGEGTESEYLIVQSRYWFIDSEDYTIFETQYGSVYQLVERLEADGISVYRLYQLVK